jgi:hypothetical protein
MKLFKQFPKIAANVAILLAMLFVSTAQASIVHWELQDVLFDDGATATGWFDYDTDTELLVAWDVTTSATGAVIPFNGHNYTTANTDLIMPEVNPYTFTLRNDDPYNDPAFVFKFESDLGVGGINILSDLSFECANSCGLSQRGVVSGSASAVPVPAAVWLFGSALAGLGWVKRKKTV